MGAIANSLDHEISAHATADGTPVRWVTGMRRWIGKVERKCPVLARWGVPGRAGPTLAILGKALALTRSVGRLIRKVEVVSAGDGTGICSSVPREY